MTGRNRHDSAGRSHLMWIVAERELREQFRNTAFRVVSIILVLAVALGVLIPAAVGGGQDIKTLGVVGDAGPDVARAADLAAKIAAVDGIKTKQIDSAGAARAALDEGSLDLALIDSSKILLKNEPTEGVQSSGSTVANALAELLGRERTLSDLPRVDRERVAQGSALPIAGVHHDQRDLTSRVAGGAAILIIYMFILINGMKITQNVAEEKSTRVVEVLLSTVRPIQLLTGKVAGIGAATFIQLTAMVATFAICGAIVGNDVIQGSAGRMVLAGAIWLLLGYAFYCAMFAAAGALISRQSDASSVSLPLLLPMILVFSLSFGVLFGESSGFFTILAYVPFTAPVAMPVLFAIGAASNAQFAISVLITLISTAIAFRICAVVYERSILRIGSRVKLGQILRADAN